MYSPVFDITETTRRMLREITEHAIPSSKQEQKLSVADVFSVHTELGGDGCFRRHDKTSHWIPVLLHALIEWYNSSPAHELIRAAVLHYELVQIRPFYEMNEEVALTLHNRILRKDSPVIMATPELSAALASENAQAVINTSLRMILTSKREKNVIRKKHKELVTDKLLAYLRQTPGCNRGEILAAFPDLSARMLDRHLQTLRTTGFIEFRGSRKTGAYYAAAQTSPLLSLLDGARTCVYNLPD